MKIHISDRGYITVKVPKKKKKRHEQLEALVLQAVTDTMQLLLPVTQAERFHPVLGKGGYVDETERFPSEAPTAQMQDEVEGDQGLSP